MFIQVDPPALDQTSRELEKGRQKLEGIRSSLRSKMSGLTSSTRYQVDGTYRTIDSLLDTLEDEMSWLASFTSRKGVELEQADRAGEERKGKGFAGFLRALSEANKIAATAVGHFVIGFGKGAWELVKGVAELAFNMSPAVIAYKWIVDPQGQMDAWAARAYMITHPGETWDMLWDMVTTDYKTRVTNGDLKSRSEYWGEMTFNIVSTLAGGGGAAGMAVKGAVKLNQAAKLAAAARAVNASAKAASVTSVTGKTSALTGLGNKAVQGLTGLGNKTVQGLTGLGNKAVGNKAVQGLTGTGRQPKAEVGNGAAPTIRVQDNKNTAGSCVGDPIHTGTGAQVMDQKLLLLHGTQSWPFELLYNSLLLQRGTLGIGWTHNYEMKLDIGEGELTLNWNAARRHTFTLGEEGIYRSADDAVRFDRIIRDETGYTLHVRATSTQYRFALTGELQWQRGETGLRLLAEQEEGRLARLIDELSGQTLHFTYNEEGLLIQVSDGTREVTLTYNDLQHLIRYIEPAGHAVEMNYTEEGQVLEGYIAGSLHFRNTYDDRGCIIAQEEGAGKVMKLAYDTDSLPGYIVTSVIDRSGREEVFVHDAHFRLIERRRSGSRMRFDYNEAGQLLSQTTDSGMSDVEGRSDGEPGEQREVLAFSYDDEGRLLAEIDALGQETRYTYGDGPRPIAMTNALGQTTVYDYDDEGRLVGMARPDGEQACVVYDARGLRVEAVDFGGATRHYRYGEDGRLLVVEDAEGRRTDLAYDASGRVTVMTDATGAVTRHDYDGGDNLIAVTDPLGRRWRMAYDAFDRLVRNEQPSCAATTYTYGVHQKPERIVDPLGRETVLAYDGEGRLVQATDPAGVTQRYEYDADGRLSAVVDGEGNQRTFRFDAADRLQEIRDALGAVERTITYDKAGNPVAVTDGLGVRTTYRYNRLRQLEQVTDALGRETAFAYDAAMRLVETQEAGAAVYRQQYTANSQLAGYIDANGNETTYRYDRSGALIEETRADGGVSTFTYDERGLLTSRTSPSGHTTQLAYDSAGHLTETSDAVGTICYGYNEDGRVTAVEENGARSEREYDAAGQLIRYTDSNGHTIRYAYDGGGRLHVLTYPDGKQVEYRYDESGRLSEVKDWAGRLTRYRYNANGLLIRTERPNRTVEVRQYDAGGRLTLLQDLAKPGIPLQQLRYTYNAIGQIEREDDKQYRYDELKRLVHSASPGRRRWYTYDAGGNLTESGEAADDTQANLTAPSLTVTQTLYYGKDNRLRANGDYPVEMDKEGNLLYVTDGKGMDGYRYDARNRLIQSVKASYEYDAENRRIRLTEGRRDTQYVWDPSQTLDGLDHMLMELDGDGKVRAYYIYGHGLIGREDAAGNYRAYLYDARGSTTLLTDEMGRVTDRYTYGPYGEEEAHEGLTNQPYRYNGRDGVMTDSDGLVYMRARYYHVQLKRFLNRDVIRGDVSDGQTFNRYAYVNGDPVNYIDPLGLFKCEGTGSAKKPGGYQQGDVDEHGYLSPGDNRALGNRNIASDNRIQSHHPIQNEWAKRWAKENGFDYNENKAPAVLLPSSSGYSHAMISAAQRQRRKLEGFDMDIRYEFNVSYRELINAGVDEKTARKVIGDAYKYFDSLGGFVK